MIKLTRKHLALPDSVANELEYQKRLAEVCVYVFH